MDHYKFLSEENKEELRKVFSEIDNREEQGLLINPRRLSEKDHADLWNTATSGGTINNVFSYANRPRQEVIQYLLDHIPQTLDRLLTNGRVKK